MTSLDLQKEVIEVPVLSSEPLLSAALLPALEGVICGAGALRLHVEGAEVDM